MRLATLLFLLQNEPPASRILLGWKKRGFGQGKYAGIGGKVLPGESIRTAARREMLEETMVQVEDAALQSKAVLEFIFPAQPEWTQEVSVFFADRWEGDPVETEEMRPGWFEAGNLPYNAMWQDNQLWLPLVLEGLRIRAVFHFAADNETVLDWSWREWDGSLVNAGDTNEQAG